MLPMRWSRHWAGRRSASGRLSCSRRWPSALIGALVEMLLLRRIYRAPELFQLLATFALVLIIQDVALWIWGPEDLLGPRAPGLPARWRSSAGAFPAYDLFLIVLGPLVLLTLWLLLTRTRWGTLVRAATEDREMVGALGVDQAGCSPRVFVARRAARRPGRRPAAAARAGQSRAGPRGHRRCLRRRRWSAAWAASPAPFSRRC